MTLGDRNYDPLFIGKEPEPQGKCLATGHIPSKWQSSVLTL